MEHHRVRGQRAAWVGEHRLGVREVALRGTPAIGMRSEPVRETWVFQQALQRSPQPAEIGRAEPLDPLPLDLAMAARLGISPSELNPAREHELRDA